MVIRLLVAFLAMTPLMAWGDIVLGSWNIKHLGWKNDKAFGQVAHVANHFDLLAIQELMETSALARLEREVEALSGEAWSSMASRDLGRSSYTEHYAFLWRESEVAYHDGAVVFLDHGDIFSREPYAARFQDVENGDLFTVATVHVVYGDSVSDRLPEIEALADYWQWLAEVAAGTPRLLMGDFNLAPDHDSWALLRALGARPAITVGQSTLATTAGEYANLYDNIWYDAAILNPSDRGILLFPELLSLEHNEARDRVSDHAPVYIGLNGTDLVPQHARGERPIQGYFVHDCIDLNASDVSNLDELPHIGPARVKDIVEGRPWQSPGNLTRINGLSEARVQAIQASGWLCE
ncbi:helix-hairpin-helix domain-containing protein [Halomonas stenophila]|uniref:Endonuclease/exonuclease/phosphatase family metal-dependent hydrolase n=1 Tax=Halomonas stenophila TaxID=795312 RepID=A0A7W5HKL9_9GAMM|nr:helix-hairpin-helix domain-containing protein [Halomonas stenophila]MBB3231970.1 endonuclease/exonuclease/phosphatase family metal-dependent hydrolase [Halomonas stenophila]